MSSIASLTTPPVGTGPWQQLYSEIGKLLFDNHLEPTPENFDICYRYLTGNDGELNSRIERALQSGGLTAVSVAAIIAQRSVDMSADDLRQLAAGAQEKLDHIISIVEESGEHVRSYGDALEENNAALADPQTALGAVDGIVAFTQTMIEKTREVEERLRISGEEIIALRNNLAEARKQADTDPLTGLPNRGSLDRRLAHAVKTARVRNKPLSIAICDIDKFKSINDMHGHLVGDEVIKFVASLLSKQDSDRLFVARFGGEEFVILFEDEDPTAAAAELNELRQRLNNLELKNNATGVKIGKLSFSAGIADLKGRANGSALLKAADTALYRAKNDGRNRVYIATPQE